jgi:sugar lactone lactonase YvrE
MKWNKDATDGTIVVRGSPRGLFVDTSETVYVSDYGSHRLMCWPKGAAQGTVIAGGNPGGDEANQLYFPWGLSSDQHGNLYVADHSSHRVQRFPIKQTN